MIDENEMRNRAEKWLDLDDKTARPVTRENALAEDMMALDVLDLLAEVERLTKERDREADRAKYHSDMRERLGLDVARARDEREQARETVKRYLADGKALHREIEKVVLTLNEIGWPSENVSATERACRALTMLAKVRGAVTPQDQEALAYARGAVSFSGRPGTNPVIAAALAVLDRLLNALKDTH